MDSCVTVDDKFQVPLHASRQSDSHRFRRQRFQLRWTTTLEPSSQLTSNNQTCHILYRQLLRRFDLGNGTTAQCELQCLRALGRNTITYLHTYLLNMPQPTKWLTEVVWYVLSIIKMNRTGKIKTQISEHTLPLLTLYFHSPSYRAPLA